MLLFYRWTMAQNKKGLAAVKQFEAGAIFVVN
jgi:hypothetical protein